MSSAIARLRTLQDRTFLLSDQTLACFRIVFFFSILALRPPSSLAWAAEYPDWLRDPPPGLPSLIGIPPTPVLVAIQWGVIIFAVMGLVGHRTRLASVGFALALLAYNSIEYSYGKIDHDLLQLVVPLTLAFSGWGNAYSFDARRHHPSGVHDATLRNSRSVAALYTFFAVTFSTAAVVKLVFWSDPSYSSAEDWVSYYRIVQTNEAVLAEAALRLPALVWEAVDWSTIAIEFAPLAFLFVPGAARRVPFFLMTFHLGVLLTMGIDFGFFLMLYIPFAAHPLAGARFEHIARRLGAAAWLAIAGVAGGAYHWILGPGLESLGGDGLAYLPELVMFAVWALLLIGFSLPPERGRRRPGGPISADQVGRSERAATTVSSASSEAKTFETRTNPSPT